MAKGKTTKGQTIKRPKEFSFGHYIVCPFIVFFDHYIVCPFVVFLWPLYCLSFCRFPLAIIFFVLLSFPFGHYTVCPLVVFVWPLYCLSFCRFSFGHYWSKEKREKDKQCNGQRKTPKGQTI
jgi:hypothetical protein